VGVTTTAATLSPSAPPLALAFWDAIGPSNTPKLVPKGHESDAEKGARTNELLLFLLSREPPLAEALGRVERHAAVGRRALVGWRRAVHFGFDGAERVGRVARGTPPSPALGTARQKCSIDRLRRLTCTGGAPITSVN
jgi:hypothetical protein